jgi:Bacterial Ig-like domain (group 3)
MRMMEPVEPRRLFSLAASAQIALVSTTGTSAHPSYNYAITLANTGTTGVGTYWLAWVPGADFLPSVPSAVTDPAGWSHSVQGEGGSSIEWVASGTSSRVSPGGKLPGFGFSSADSPTVLKGKAPSSPSTDVLTSFVYSGSPFSDSGLSFRTQGLDAKSGGLVATSVPAPKVAASFTFKQPSVVKCQLASSDSTNPYTGSVTVTENDDSVGTASVTSSGAVSFSTATLNLHPGNHRLQIVYSGDAHRDSGTSPAFALRLAKATTTTTLKTSASAAVAGQPLTLTAKVSASSAPAAGSVSFKNGRTLLATVPLSGQTASFTMAHLSVGPGSFTASYSGDADYAGSTSTARTVTTSKSSPSLDITTTTAQPTAGSPLSITASFRKRPAGSYVPSGRITFADDGKVLGTAPINADGNASFVATLTRSGPHTLTATYSGDKNTSSPHAATLRLTLAAAL